MTLNEDGTFSGEDIDLSLQFTCKNGKKVDAFKAGGVLVKRPSQIKTQPLRDLIVRKIKANEDGLEMSYSVLF